MNRPLHLLVIEDNPGDARLLVEALADARLEATVVRAASLAEAQARLDAQIDAILLDLGLPDSQGIATVIAMRDHAPHVPIVVTTGFDDDAAGLESVRLGAQDYLVKSHIDGRLLARAIRYAIERKHSEDRLRTMSESLAASNKALDEFVSVAAHDLRDPLAKILAVSQSLRADGDGMSLEDRGLLDEINRSARRMQRLIDALLGYARTVGRSPRVERFPLRRIIDEVLDDLAVKLAEQHGQVAVEVAGDVLADPVQVRQVVQNLLSNALKFSAGRPPRIAITAVELPTGFTRVSVADNGEGFDMRDADRIFRPFAQLEPAGGNGIGLGLAICRRIVEAHGGESSVTAATGAGATFTFTLPTAPGVTSHAERTR